MARLQHDCLSGCAPRAPGRSARRSGARQLRLVRQARLHHRADAAHDHRQPGGAPLWSTETVSTYVYKRAFEWNTFDLGYPSAIAVLWFIIILVFIAIMTRLLRQRD